MITVNDILTQWLTFKDRVSEYYTLIYNEVAGAPLLNGLSDSKTEDHNIWMHLSAGIAAIMDGVWEDRKKEIQDVVDSVIPMPDRWFQRECLKFQYGDSLAWDNEKGRYYYPVIDTTKQIIKRCATPRSGGTTFVKVATDTGALSAPQLTAFIAFVNQIQMAGSNVATPTSFASDKLNAPLTVYYDGTKPLADIKAIVEAAFNEYLVNDNSKPGTIPFNGEYSINKHADYIEAASVDIKEVNTGVVQAKSNAGAYNNVNRVYNPVSGYLEKDPAITFDAMITYVAV
jgi:hypothetical protein